MIEQFGEFLLGIQRLAEGRQYGEALTQIDDAFKESLGMDSNFINNAPVDYLVLMTSVGRVGDIDKTMVLADLLNAEAEVYEMKGDYAQSDRRYQIALDVLTTVAARLAHRPTDDHMARIDQFVSKLTQERAAQEGVEVAEPVAEPASGIPFEIKHNLFPIYERVGRFDKAEDMLFELLDEAQPEEEQAIGNDGIAFYERLLQLSDYELESGGLPRAEVEESLHELTDGPRANV